MPPPSIARYIGNTDVRRQTPSADDEFHAERRRRGIDELRTADDRNRPLASVERIDKHQTEF